jgi:hypothetical protein
MMADKSGLRSRADVNAAKNRNKGKKERMSDEAINSLWSATVKKHKDEPTV